MKKSLLSLVALTLLTSAAPLAKAQEEAANAGQPVVVATFSGYAELKRDLGYLGTLSGNPEMAQGLEQLLMLFTQNQGLAGLDQKRPWGAALSIGAEGGFPVLVFLPVDDLKKLLDALGAIVGAAVDAGDGVFEIKQGAMTLFIKQQGKWAYLAQQKSELEKLPADPLVLLGGIDKQYDLAVSANIQNLPQALRDQAADALKAGMEMSLQQNVDPDDEQSQLQAQIARNQAEQLVASINQLDKVTLGFSIDAENNHSFIDIGVTALPGSDLARQLAESTVDAGSSKVAGFLLPDSVLSLHLNSAVSKSDREQSEAALAGFRTQIMEEIDKSEELDDDQAKAKVKQLAGKALDVLDKTLEKGQVNLGLAVVGEGPLTLVAGVLVADGPALEKVVKEFINLAADDPTVPKPKLNAAEYKGVRFHTLSLPAPEDEGSEWIKEYVGENIDIAVGFGADRIYLSIGKDGIDTLKQAIDRSATTPETELPPMKLSLALAPLMKLVAAKQGGGNPQTEMLVQQLKEGGKDHINVTVEPVDNGVRYRIEAEEGINKLLGAQLGGALRTRGAGGF
ncbi:MAG TPA: hypothetical protein VJ783_18805 [Pirellulales bacterium]|nr:hypothetical protein [Pirellulales bacterium]